MATKQILLILEADADAEPACCMAAQLAGRDGAKVRGCCLFHEPEVSVEDSFAIGPAAVAEVIEHEADAIRKMSAKAHAAFHAAIANQGLADNWRLAEVDDWRNALPSELLLADVVVLARAPDSRAYRRMMERLMLECSQPCFVAPQTSLARGGFDRIILAWNGSRESARAMRDAMPFLAKASTVFVATDAERVTSADADNLLRYLARHDVHAQALQEKVDGHAAGDWLLDKCAAVAADLLVMGAYGHTRAAEAILGGATRTVLARADLPVLLSR